MAFKYTSIRKEWAPFAPDANGYCYIDTKHFNMFMRAVARHLIPRHGRPIDLIPHIALIVIAVSFFLWLFLPFFKTNSWTIISMQIVISVFLIWYTLRITRFIKVIIRQRMCFDCGYTLRKTPTDENGYGRCSECGATFHLGYYCKLPKGYKRKLPPSGIAMLAGSLPPIDIIRMQKDASLQSAEDAAPQPPPKCE